MYMIYIYKMPFAIAKRKKEVSHLEINPITNGEDLYKESNKTSLRDIQQRFN